MAVVTFKAFMSCSFSQEDQHIVEFFKSYCESFGFEILKYDFQEPVRLTDGIKSHINNADCLIAIATRRNKLQDSREWICPDWIEHEVVYANALGKPIAIFAESGVRIDGLISRDERYQRFSREESELLRETPQFNKFLLSLRGLLEYQFKTGSDSSPVLFRHVIRSRDEMVLPSKVLTTVEVEIESLIDNLKQCHHGFGDIDWLRVPQDAVKDFEFSVLQAPPDTSVKYEVGRRKEHPDEWYITFDPPLQIGQRVRYAFRSIGEKVRPFTVEEAEEAISTKKFWSDRPRCAINWEILYPTGELVSEALFPPKYPIYEPEFHVEIGESGTESLEEMERVRESNAFKIQRFFDRYTLTLSVIKPVRGCKYLITWRPPHASEIE